MQNSDDLYMRRAINWAMRGKRETGGEPFGCVIVVGSEVIGEGYNEVFAQCDASAHAEIVAMRRAGQRRGNPLLRGATLYSTLSDE